MKVKVTHDDVSALCTEAYDLTYVLVTTANQKLNQGGGVLDGSEFCKLNQWALALSDYTDITFKPRIWNRGATAVSLETHLISRITGSRRAVTSPTSASPGVGVSAHFRICGGVSDTFGGDAKSLKMSTFAGETLSLATRKIS